MNNIQNDSYCTTIGLLTATGAETVHDTTATINYVVADKAEQKTAITDGTTPTTGHVSGSAITVTAGYGRVVVWGLISGGTVKVVEGPLTTWDGTNFGSGGAPELPALPNGFAPFAYTVIKGGSTVSGTWTFGSSNWNATGITLSTQDIVGGLPVRPQTS